MHPSHKYREFYFSRVSLRSRGIFSRDIVSEGPMSPSSEDMQGVMVVVEAVSGRARLWLSFVRAILAQTP